MYSEWHGTPSFHLLSRCLWTNNVGLTHELAGVHLTGKTLMLWSYWVASEVLTFQVCPPVLCNPPPFSFTKETGSCRSRACRGASHVSNGSPSRAHTELGDNGRSQWPPGSHPAGPIPCCTGGIHMAMRPWTVTPSHVTEVWQDWKQEQQTAQLEGRLALMGGVCLAVFELSIRCQKPWPN